MPSPVRSFNTAATYYLHFRLVHPTADDSVNAPAAALLTACKIEDTLKKPRDILCADYNLRLGDTRSPDDPVRVPQLSKTC